MNEYLSWLTNWRIQLCTGKKIVILSMVIAGFFSGIGGGLVYIGGTHPAAEGGAYMVAIKGFAGIYFEDGKIKAKPDLPKAWKKMRFHICYRNKKYKIEIEDNNANIVEI